MIWWALLGENLENKFGTRLEKLQELYTVSIKSLYNFKNLLQRQLMRYLRQILFYVLGGYQGFYRIACQVQE